jgi:hypothetical protein
MIHPLKVVAILGAFALLCLVVITMLPRSAYAAQPPIPLPCQDAEEARDRLVKGDATHFDWRELETMHADKILFFEFHGFVMYVLTKKGCVVSGPAVVDYSKDRGDPA